MADLRRYVRLNSEKYVVYGDRIADLSYLTNLCIIPSYFPVFHDFWAGNAFSQLFLTCRIKGCEI
jgi:hypothetical protein